MTAEGVPRHHVSVVVPLGRWERWPSIAGSLRDQVVPPDEIVFVCPSLRERPPSGPVPIRWCTTGRLLAPGAMRNRGAAVAEGDLLFFLDDDCLPPPEWIAQTISLLDAREDAGAVACRVVSPRGTFGQRCADYVLFSASQHRRSMDGCVGSAALGVRRAAFAAAGGFDGELLASEDWDFSLRLRKAGWATRFDAGVTVLHDHDRVSFGAIVRQAYRSGRRSGLIVQRRHGGLMWPGWAWIVRSSHPLLYPFWGVALTAAMCIRTVRELRDVDPHWPLYVPVLLIARAGYQCGVWARLAHERESGALTGKRELPSGEAHDS